MLLETYCCPCVLRTLFYFTFEQKIFETEEENALVVVVGVIAIAVYDYLTEPIGDLKQGRFCL